MVSVLDQWNQFPRDIPIVATTFNFEWETIDRAISLDGHSRMKSVVFADRYQCQSNRKLMRKCCVA